ncbi:MAG: hypothetical protein ACLKAO_03800 [Alkaliphilus sp.]
MDEKVATCDYRFIERILYDYKTYAVAIKNLEFELGQMLFSESTSIVAFSAGNSENNSEVEINVIKRNDSVRAKWIKKKIEEKKMLQETVEIALENMIDEELAFTNAFYYQGRSRRESQEKLFVSKHQFYKLKKSVISKIAKALGVM